MQTETNIKDCNINDMLAGYTGTENWYFNAFWKLIGLRNYTEGVKALLKMCSAYWFLDIIASYQMELRKYNFQSWTLVRNDDDSAVVTCEDGNGNVLKTQEISYTDFEPKQATIWVEYGTALLPSEH